LHLPCAFVLYIIGFTAGMMDEVDDSQKVIKLQRTWAFYVDAWIQLGAPSKSVDSKLASKFDTVHGFWHAWSSFGLQKLPPNSNIRLFKESISPWGEDPANQNGGKFVIVCTPNDSPTRIWLFCMLALIGEQFDHAEDLCGTVLSIRTSTCYISLWNKDSLNKGSLQETENQLSNLLNIPKEKIRYQVHKTSLETNKSFSLKLRSSHSDTFTASKSPAKVEVGSSTPSTPTPSSTEADSVDNDKSEDDFSTPFVELLQKERQQQSIGKPKPLQQTTPSANVRF